MEQTTTRKPQPPCIGLCYLEKIGKIAKKNVKQAEDDKEDDYDVEGSVGDDGDYEEDYEDKWDWDELNIKYYMFPHLFHLNYIAFALWI